MAGPNDEVRLGVWRPAPIRREGWAHYVRDNLHLSVVGLAVMAVVALIGFGLGLLPLTAGLGAVLVSLIAIYSVLLPVLLLVYLCGNPPSLPVKDYGDGLNRANVIVRLFYKEYVYAEDQGEMTVVDGWLIFEGSRCDFSLAPHDIADGHRIPAQWGRPKCGFKLAGPLKDIQVLVLADDDYHDPGDLLGPWHWAWRHHQVGGISVLPPIDPMPGYWRGRFREGKRKQVQIFAALCVLAGVLIGDFGGFALADSLVGLAGQFWVIVAATYGVQEFDRRYAMRRLAALRASLGNDGLESQRLSSTR